MGSKISADGDYSHKIIRCLFLGRKAMTKLDSVLKSRDITLLEKVYIVKAIVFELWCLERALESSLDWKEIKPVNPK